MKNLAPHLLFLSALIVGALCGAKGARAEEVTIEKVFVPYKGYDDNDNVLIRVEGTLPDPCYVLGSAEVSALPAQIFEIHQYAWRRDDGVCSTRDDLPEASFSKDISLGRLDAGEYKIIQRPSEGAETFRMFDVAKASVGKSDDLHLANVTNVSVADVGLAGQDVKATVSGMLSSSCDTIGDVQVERENDVFIVTPIERPLEHALASPIDARIGSCGYVLKFFSREVDLGRLPMGEYMILVRGESGQAMQRTFQILNP